jgi:uncharacterized membrane protein (DUF2068 family)
MRNVTRSRPRGVTILAIGLAVLAIVDIIIVAVGFTRVPGVALVWESIFLLAAGFPLLIAWGLWTLQRWAFWLTVIAQVFQIGNGSFLLLRGNFNWSILLLNLFIPAVILIYLFTDRNVRRVFRQ